MSAFMSRQTRQSAFMILCTLAILLLKQCPSSAFVPSAVKQQVSSSSSRLYYGDSRSRESKRRKDSPSRSRTKGTEKKRPQTNSKDPYQSTSRPILMDYQANRNPFTNKQRLVQDIACPHFETCSGCSISSRVDKVDTIQSARLFFSSTLMKNKRVDGASYYYDDYTTTDDLYPVVVPSQVVQWRTQAKLAVAPKSSSWAKDGCVFGLYSQGTHIVQSIPDCQVHHPVINRAVQLLETASARVGTPAFKREVVSLRYVQLQVERSTNTVCLTMVWNAEQLKDTHPHLSRLTKELRKLDPTLWHSMWCHCNDGPGNNIFSRNSKRWHHLSGPEFVREPISVGDRGWLYFTPLNFRQANMDGFDILANDVARAVPGGSRVCELYAGVGLLGLTALAYHADGTPLMWVRCSDENPSNPKCFERSVDSLPVTLTNRGQKNNDDDDEGMTLAQLAAILESGEAVSKPKQNREKTSYMVASATNALLSGEALGANVLIVDPPRKGLEDGVLNELCKTFNPSQPCVESVSGLAMMPNDRINWVNDVDTLIYVSCGFDALARDAEELVKGNAGWRLESSTGYVLFPGSNHVETLCIFKRNLQ